MGIDGYSPNEGSAVSQVATDMAKLYIEERRARDPENLARYEAEWSSLAESNPGYATNISKFRVVQKLLAGLSDEDWAANFLLFTIDERLVIEWPYIGACTHLLAGILYLRSIQTEDMYKEYVNMLQELGFVDRHILHLTLVNVFNAIASGRLALPQSV